MNMTREEAIKSLKNIIEYWTYKPTEVEAAKMAISALRPVSRDQIERKKRRWEVQTDKFPYYYCSGCGESFEIHSYDKEKYRFCPYCMSPMTDEAVDITLKRMEALLND
jgi:hypothetical protein|nr:MAG TPA: DNA-directed RNA polymerase [Caudoviricetes sp.]